MEVREIADKLNGDLSREYAHWHFYVDASINVCGLHREELREFFFEAAKSEMEHVKEWGDLIVGLGFAPVTYAAPHDKGIKDARTIIRCALKMEREVIKNYVQRIKDAVELQESGFEVDGKFIEIFLEDQIMDSRKDADNLLRLWNCSEYSNGTFAEHTQINADSARN